MASDSSSFSTLEHMLNILGAFTVLWLFLKIAWVIGETVRVYVLAEKWKGVDLASYGPWAVVTGATAGIGKAYTHELAKRGLDVVLISRSVEKLKQVAAEIESAIPQIFRDILVIFRMSEPFMFLKCLGEQQHGRNTKVIQTDFTRGSESYEPIRAALQGLEIGILVNNVGMSADPGHFVSLPDIDMFINDIVNCNMLSVVKMTQILLPQMVARKKGVIINVSSVAGQHPFPNISIYSSTKASIDFFSQGLDMEYGPQGIIVQSIMPIFVDSKMTTTIHKILKVSPKNFARQALNTVGLTNRASGCLYHHIQNLAFNLVCPEWLHLWVVGTPLFDFVGKVM